MSWKIRKYDIIILTIAAIFLGAFIAIQASIIKPSSGSVSNDSGVMAVEIEHIAKTNTELKNQLSDLTKKYQAYKDALNNQSSLSLQVNKDLSEYETVNGATETKGQGIVVTISDKLSEPQLVDLINAIKNIGADAISINGARLGLHSSIDQNAFTPPYNIEIIGNSAILQSSLSRKGGIIEQLTSKGINIDIAKKADIIMPPIEQPNFKFATVKNN